MFISSTSKFGFGIAFLVAVLLVHAAVSTSIMSIEVSDLGLIKRLPLSFWIGLVLVGCLWFAATKSSFCSKAALILTLSYLFVAPAIMKVPIWISQSYYPFAESMLINSSGHLAFRSTALFKSYQLWPGFLYMGSAITIVTVLPPYMLLKYFPLLTISLYGLLAFLILRTKMGTLFSIFGAAWFLGGFFLRQQYFGPPSMAYVFFLMIFLVVAQFFSDKDHGKRTILLLLLLFFVTTFTHVLTSLMAIITMAAVYLTHVFVHNHVRSKRLTSIVVTICTLFVVAFLSYNVFAAPHFYEWVVRVFVNVFSGVRQLGIYKEPNRVMGSTASQLNYTSSWAIVLLNGAVVLTSVLIAIKNRRSHSQGSDRRYLLFSIVVLMGFALFAFTAEYGPHESYQRAFMFGLIPLSYLSVDLLQRKPKILPLMLTALIFLNVPAQYGSDSYTLATDTELGGAAFFATRTPEKTSCLHEISMYIRYYDPGKDIAFRTLVRMPPTSIPNALEIDEVLGKVEYILLSDLQENYYLYFLGVNPLDHVNFGSLNKIYDNGDVRTFKHANQTSPL